MTEGLMAAALLLLCLCALLLCAASAAGMTLLWLRQRRGGDEGRGEGRPGPDREELDRQWQNLWDYDGAPQGAQRGDEE
ncbi:hypothetical protein [Bittarella sp. HCP28S3_D9]|uniref:hypothetical protein n=1 Tax=Bittarella sp. HCP28S3_D9 TaxID=3440253 RepID=UPI003F8AF633